MGITMAVILMIAANMSSRVNLHYRRHTQLEKSSKIMKQKSTRKAQILETMAKPVLTIKISISK